MKFPTLAVLSVTSGRLITQPRNREEGNGIGQLYELLGWMTDDSPFTHQLPRFADECKPWIHRWYPEIVDVDKEIVERCESGDVAVLVKELLVRFGNEIELQKIPKDNHTKKNAIDELVEMRGTSEGIILVDGGA